MPAGPADEQELIARSQGGDTRAYDALVSHYLGRVISIAWGIVKNAQDAEDLAQEAFVSAYQNIGRFRTGEPFGPWIFRIVTNRALDSTATKALEQVANRCDRWSAAALPPLSHAAEPLRGKR